MCTKMKKCTFIFSSACLGGYYGPNCVEMCSNHCLVPQNCDRKTGECTGGCQTGWKTPKCKESKDGFIRHGGSLFKHFVLQLHAYNDFVSMFLEETKPLS